MRKTSLEDLCESFSPARSRATTNACGCAKTQGGQGGWRRTMSHRLGIDASEESAACPSARYRAHRPSVLAVSPDCCPCRDRAALAAGFGVARIKVDDSLSQLFRSDTPEFKQ